MAASTMEHLVKKYDDGFPAVNDISIDIADGEFLILVGPSGCGKSTLLRMVVGLEDLTSGDLKLNGERVNERQPRERNLAMVRGPGDPGPRRAPRAQAREPRGRSAPACGHGPRGRA